MDKLTVAKNVEEYILQFPESVQASLRQLRLYQQDAGAF